MPFVTCSRYKSNFRKSKDRYCPRRKKAFEFTIFIVVWYISISSLIYRARSADYRKTRHSTCFEAKPTREKVGVYNADPFGTRNFDEHIAVGKRMNVSMRFAQRRNSFDQIRHIFWSSMRFTATTGNIWIICVIQLLSFSSKVERVSLE